MADGAYERRGPREAELRRLARMMEETRAGSRSARISSGASGGTPERRKDPGPGSASREHIARPGRPKTGS